MTDSLALAPPPTMIWRGYTLPLEVCREIATVEAELAATKTQNAILESMSRQRVERDNAEVEATRNWRDLCVILGRAKA